MWIQLNQALDPDLLVFGQLDFALSGGFFFLQAEKFQFALDGAYQERVVAFQAVKALGKLAVVYKIKVLIVLLHVEHLNAALKVGEDIQEIFEFCEQLCLVFLDALESFDWL